MNNDALRASAAWVRKRIGDVHPFCALILGSGWGQITGSLSLKRSLSYAEIPGLGATGVDGHSGVLHLTDLDGATVLVFQGRRHWYEGCGWDPVALPVFLCVELGVSVLVLTNAAGGIRSDLAPGDLMVIDDHINLMGVNPLTGEHAPIWGPRFPDQTQVYDLRLREGLDSVAQRIGLKLRHGVYAATAGPSYETPAEIAAFRTLGADAVGMSTVPEAMLAHAAGLRVAGLSCITNRAAGLASAPLFHGEVIMEAQRNAEKMVALLSEFLRSLKRPTN